MVRVNALVRREISEILHTRFRSECVSITITEVKVANDLRSARVYYAVLGGEEDAQMATAFLKTQGREIRHLLGNRVVLKYTPFLKFVHDESVARGFHMNNLLDELDLEEELDWEEEEESN